MDALSVNPLGPATVKAVGALPPLAITAPGASNSLTVQDLAQSLFRQSLQAATSFPLTEPAGGLLNLAPEATAALLASLSTPQVATSSTASLSATTSPAILQPTADAGSTAPSPNPAASAVSDPLPAQDAFATSSSPDFAMEAALRFGSGVIGSSPQASVSPSRSIDLVRDAAAVTRPGSVQPHAGGPGPENFLRTQTDLSRILRDYRTAPEPAQIQPEGLDLMA
ncbi:hypothetical protein [Geothrix sp. PMB-07]|uniref:hypothetical protein n=1 Tax=Geothrix sp. PMB-07 TaxID=3068640 RepID=UPI00274269C2|nr:hypothetical protein [Geothrix sp. PMB-07]WLT31356.1 hypothetical protein Q9293_16715 [Geothrix sp. PMB-07]